MWDLIVSVPDHCLPFYFAIERRRGGVVRALGCGVQSLRFESHSSQRLENSHCPPSSEWVP